MNLIFENRSEGFYHCCYKKSGNKWEINSKGIWVKEYMVF